MPLQTAPLSRYTVTYAFNDDARAASSDVIRLIRQTAVETRQRGLDIEFLGATCTVDRTGHLSELTVDYEAVSKAAPAYLNWRAGLPASGSPQVVPADDGSESVSCRAHTEPLAPR